MEGTSAPAEREHSEEDQTDLFQKCETHPCGFAVVGRLVIITRGVLRDSSGKMPLSLNPFSRR